MPDHARHHDPALVVAVHEAGHAVVALLVGMSVGRVRIPRVVLEGAMTPGSTELGPARRGHGERDQAVVNLVAQRLAGPLAEAIVDDPSTPDLASRPDADEAHGLLERFARGDESRAGALFQEATDLARRLIDERREAILRVAELLVERGELTGEDVADVVFPGWRNDEVEVEFSD